MAIRRAQRQLVRWLISFENVKPDEALEAFLPGELADKEDGLAWTQKITLLDYRSTTFGDSVSHLRHAIIPSFLHRDALKGTFGTTKVHPTAWLDGLRGFAALFVFFYHFEYAYHNGSDHGWGLDGNNRWLVQLPIIRLFYAGPAMVSVFFVVSGFSLSAKPAKLIQAGSWAQLLDCMCSSIFRRALRLFLPCVASTFMVAIATWLRFFEWPGHLDEVDIVLPGRKEWVPPRRGGLFDQLHDWWGATCNNLLNLWNFDHPFVSYDVHLWTIPVEYRCSIIVFVTVLAFAKLRTWIRFMLTGLLCWYTIRTNQWEMTLFYSGSMLAYYNQLQKSQIPAHDGPINSQEQSLPSNARLPSPARFELFSSGYLSSIGIGMTASGATGSFTRFRPYLWPSVHLFLFSLALFFLSSPDSGAGATPGYRFLSSLVPTTIGEAWRFWHIVGSVLLVFVVSKVSFFQRWFDNSFARYLGRISYSLYLLHGPLNHSAGYAIVGGIMGLVGREGMFRYELGFLLGSVFHVFIVIWASDLFARGVDEKVVVFARWIERKCRLLDV